MNFFRKTFLAIVMAPFFAGCLEYTTPMCTDDKLSDVPGMEGEHSLRMFDSTKYEFTNTDFKIQRESKGVYSVDGAPYLRTCQIAGKYFAEAQTQHGTYEGTLIYPTIFSGFNTHALLVDKRDLDDAAISYEIVEREIQEMNLIKKFPKFKNYVTQYVKQDPPDAPPKARVMIIDNANQSELLMKYSKAMSFGISTF